MLVCQSGIRATDAQRRLAAAGMAYLHVLDGGVPRFARAGGPARCALERQVRLADSAC
ncbi:hypothetical protein I4I84_11700 [Pseudonocardia sp. KRD-182]|uniref:rhodanese-like domain-containing protein n=1 Tax=Pseudonocardia oceani TaxID=2792013 RepID=UPI001C4A1D53|nr:rhodanese-like domain-containing protein [Pseudonocardia oceani]MBW0109383.1 hypothetical protein [Pseudonocardia oceani]